MELKNCLYCRRDKAFSELSLEHVIPQFLGGAAVSDKLKTRDVCSFCNNNLGLFVDAGFEKNWFVSHRLIDVHLAFYRGERPAALPLRCLGESKSPPPEVPHGFLCETWVTQFGGQFHLIRPSDKRLYWYMGGNPITMKSEQCVAYCVFAGSESEMKTKTQLLSFARAFSDRQVKKVICGEVEGVDLKELGFSEPDELDQKRINFYFSQFGTSQEMQFTLNMNDSYRFLAKIGIGFVHCLFGREALNNPDGEDLYESLNNKNLIT